MRRQIELHKYWLPGGRISQDIPIIFRYQDGHNIATACESQLQLNKEVIANKTLSQNRSFIKKVVVFVRHAPGVKPEPHITHAIL